MQDNPQPFPGANWCDVFAHPDGWAFVRSEGSVIVCLVNGVERWRFDVGQKILFLRGASSTNGTVAAIMQGNATGRAIYIDDDGIPVDLGQTFGQDCTAIAFEDGQFVAYILRSSTTYSRRVDGQDVVHECVETSQGWLDVVGGLQWTDANRERTVGGITLALPFARGGVPVGQATTGSVLQVTAVLPDGRASTVIRGVSFEPRVAASADGVYAICARTPDAALLALCPPWPAYDTGGQVPSPGPGTPTPTPEPSRLAVTVDGYGVVEGEDGHPSMVFLDYRVEGHNHPFEPLVASLMINGQASDTSHDQPNGRLMQEVSPGEYDLGMRVESQGRTGQTGRPRIVRVPDRPETTPAPEPTPTPPLIDTDPAVHLNRTATRDTVRLLYLDVLKREPDPSGLAHYVDALMAGTLDSAGLRTILTNAKED